MTPDETALLRALLAEARETNEQLRGLRLDLAESRGAADARLALLLRAARAALGCDPFTAAQLVDLAAAKLSTRIALSAAVQAVAGTTRQPSKSLGRFLAQHAGHAADGLRLVRVRGPIYRIESAESRGPHHWPS